jgi:muramoyltetrapeptide carboxypeptidase
MLKGRPLVAGDRIALVATASPFDKSVVEAGRAEILRLGYEPVHDETLFARDGFVSGSAKLRAEAFTRVWCDSRIAAIMAVRGGYGSAQLLPLLDVETLRRTPKVFVGYSDTTSLAAWLTCHVHTTAVHGPMLDGQLAVGPEAYDRASLVRLLSGESGVVLAPTGVQIERAGEAIGPLYGGTLTQLTASLGTPYGFDPPDGCVLFIEDVNERPYRIDRMLTQLRHAGILGRASALVCGEMPGCDEPGGGITARAVIRGVADAFEGPMLSGFPSGHTTGPCWSLPLGSRVKVVSAPAPSVIVEEPVVG